MKKEAEYIKIADKYQEKEACFFLTLIEFDERKTVYEKRLRNIYVVFLIKGSISISTQHISKQIIEEGNMIFLPTGSHLMIHSHLAGKLLLLKLDENIELYKYFEKKDILQAGANRPVLKLLKFDDVINAFLNSLIVGSRAEIKDSRYFEIKQAEFLLLLNSLYEKEDFISFFYPMFQDDFAFKSFVFKNFNKAKSVKNLAQMSNMSLRTFQTYFKKIIGESPFEWINKQRIEQILFELKYTNKPIKEISDANGFSSVVYFNDYCKRNLGDTPAKFRKNHLTNKKTV